MGKPDVIDEKVSLDIKTVNNIEEKKDLDVYFFLKQNIKCDIPYVRMKIIKLWGNSYRINWFGRKVVTFKRGADTYIVQSAFVTIKIEDNEIKIRELVIS
ncbi:MAG: hypothetical protein WC942_11540 [Clostridia bacterium]|jgi:hypothetical protein